MRAASSSMARHVEPRTKDVAREMYEIIEQDSVLAVAHDPAQAE